MQTGSGLEEETWNFNGGAASEQFIMTCEIAVDALWLTHLRLLMSFSWIYCDCPKLWAFLWICSNQIAFCKGLGS